MILRIPDSNAKKPEDWDEDAPEKIEDVNALKPNDWLEDEAEFVPDEKAQKPTDWYKFTVLSAKIPKKSILSWKNVKLCINVLFAENTVILRIFCFRDEEMDGKYEAPLVSKFFLLFRNFLGKIFMFIKEH